MFFVWTMLLIVGCANQDNNYQVVREILSLAQEDKVEGKLRVHLNGKVEAGLNEGVYFGSPGSIVQGDLEFKIKNVTAENADNFTVQK
jgi:hypothetical protein